MFEICFVAVQCDGDAAYAESGEYCDLAEMAKNRWEVKAILPESSIEESEGSTGIGIQGIRERLSLLGGSLTIESIFGGGTTLFVTIPRPGEEKVSNQDGQASGTESEVTGIPTALKQ